MDERSSSTNMQQQMYVQTALGCCQTFLLVSYTSGLLTRRILSVYEDFDQATGVRLCIDASSLLFVSFVSLGNSHRDIRYTADAVLICRLLNMHAAAMRSAEAFESQGNGYFVAA